VVIFRWTITTYWTWQRPQSQDCPPKAEAKKADTSALEQEIDRLVYELYGLTDEEIAVVEKR
jgi:hypothetical protein